jgi:hypothetical protein
MIKIAQIWIAAFLLFTIVAGNSGQIDLAPVCPKCGTFECCPPAVCTEKFSLVYTTATVTFTMTTILTSTTVVPTSVIELVEICSYRPIPCVPCGKGCCIGPCEDGVCV